MKKLLCIILCAVTVVFSGCNLEMPNDNSAAHYVAENQNGVTVFCLDVGQADCTFINYNNISVLIDAGNPNNADFIINFLKELNISKINYLIATHPHQDHIGGMADIINYFEIENIYLPKISNRDMPTTKVYEKFLDAVKQENCNVFAATGGTVIKQDSNFKYEILAPNSTDYGNLNNYSVVTKLTFYKTSMLFMGDAETEIENEIIKNKYNISANIIRLGHHGSYTSSSKKFLKNVNPSDTVISCGRNNSYKHPSNSTLTRLTDLNKNIYRTDISGSIIVSIKNNGYSITTDSNLNLNGGY